MPYRVYNMDACFYNDLGIYSFETQCEMLQDIGYEGSYLALWTEQAHRDLEKLSQVQDKYGLEVAGVYVALDLALGVNHPANRRVLQMLERLEGCTTVEIAIRSAGPGLAASDPAGDEAVLHWLNPSPADRRTPRHRPAALLPFWILAANPRRRAAALPPHRASESGHRLLRAPLVCDRRRGPYS